MRTQCKYMKTSYNEVSRQESFITGGTSQKFLIFQNLKNRRVMVMGVNIKPCMDPRSQHPDARSRHTLLFMRTG